MDGRALGDGAPRKVLVALALYPDGLTKSRVAALAGIKQKTSTLRNALSSLRTAGFVTGSDILKITEDGLAEVGDSVNELPTGEELLEHWRSKLGEGAPRRIFDLLVDAWPDSFTNDEIAERTGIEPGTSTLRNAMSRLRSLGLVVGQRADDDLMEAIRG